MSINYTVPATISDDFLNGLNEIVQSTILRGGDRIGEVYCSLPRSQTGHARSPNLIQNATVEKLADFTSELKSIGISLNYALNGPWQGGRERTKEGIKLIIDEVETLVSIGINRFILSNPYLISKLRANVPNVHIIGSVLMRASTVREIGNCIALGCDTVVIDSDSNRDFSLLRELGRAYGNRVTLIANTTCLIACPLHMYHSLESGLFSITEDPAMPQESLNFETPRYCMEYCYTNFRLEPVNFLKMPWIRPEDVGEYEKIGIRHLKIQGRTLCVKDQLMLIKAYLERKSPKDDLFSIFPGFLDYVYRDAKEQGAPTENNPLHISNSRLNQSGFFLKFVEGSVDCRLGCDRCGHCQRTWATLG